MFGRLHLLLASTFVAVLFGEVFGDLQSCNQTYVGRLVGSANTLPTVFLKEYHADWTVYVPTPSQCGTVNGVYADVCDYDVAPDAAFESMTILKVHRKGQLAQKGSVTLTVYCY